MAKMLTDNEAAGSCHLEVVNVKQMLERALVGRQLIAVESRSKRYDTENEKLLGLTIARVSFSAEVTVFLDTEFTDSPESPERTVYLDPDMTIIVDQEINN